MGPCGLGVLSGSGKSTIDFSWEMASCTWHCSLPPRQLSNRPSQRLQYQYRFINQSRPRCEYCLANESWNLWLCYIISMTWFATVSGIYSKEFGALSSQNSYAGNQQQCPLKSCCCCACAMPVQTHLLAVHENHYSINTSPAC